MLPWISFADGVVLKITNDLKIIPWISFAGLLWDIDDNDDDNSDDNSDGMMVRITKIIPWTAFAGLSWDIDDNDDRIVVKIINN